MILFHTPVDLNDTSSVSLCQLRRAGAGADQNMKRQNACGRDVPDSAKQQGARTSSVAEQSSSSRRTDVHETTAQAS